MPRCWHCCSSSTFVCCLKKKLRLKTTHTSCERERDFLIGWTMTGYFLIIWCHWRLVRLVESDWIISRRKKRGRCSKVTHRSLIPKVPGNLPETPLKFLRPGLLCLCPTCWVLNRLKQCSWKTWSSTCEHEHQSHSLCELCPCVVWFSPGWRLRYVLRLILQVSALDWGFALGCGCSPQAPTDSLSHFSWLMG